MERRRQATARASVVRVAITHSLRQNEDHTSNTRWLVPRSPASRVRHSQAAEGAICACRDSAATAPRLSHANRGSRSTSNEGPTVDRCYTTSASAFDRSSVSHPATGAFTLRRVVVPIRWGACAWSGGLWVGRHGCFSGESSVSWAVRACCSNASTKSGGRARSRRSRSA